MFAASRVAQTLQSVPNPTFLKGLTRPQIRVIYPMRKYLLLLPLIGALACNPFDRQAAEESITEIILAETDKLNATEVSLDLAMPASDSVIVDSNWVLTRLTLNTTFESETLAISFNEEFKNDSFVTIGDSARVSVIRKFEGVLNSEFVGRTDGTEYANGRDFSSRRIQYVQFADNEEWEMVAYSIAEERSDTNTTRIFSLKIEGGGEEGGLDTTIYSSAALAAIDSFPAIAPGATLSLELRTVADTSKLVCFALANEVVRFAPKEGEEERWEAEVTAGEETLLIGIIRKDGLANPDYPADVDIWIIPVAK